MLGISEFVYGEDMKVYTRVQNRFLPLIDGKRYVLTIAAIDVYDEAQMGKGRMTELLAHLEANCRGRVDGIVVECVNNPRLAAYLRRRGFEDTDLGAFERELSPTLFKALG
ncbi:hypothetical protein Salmuc_02141 [Salipiger mucosus DSM 16094]|uniref:N-acetyltransferase domain-containing protein n=2 Tax=Salipiger mucosus TaxID=263378 RepID=S9QVA7_9RHOB|nr:hypothetical protein Salmuc_02141 [Salipiger mucosus DSM 16094]